ncbi:Serine/arginine repetitive matrix protein 2, partial [Ophiophagus hannah]
MQCNAIEYSRRGSSAKSAGNAFWGGLERLIDYKLSPISSPRKFSCTAAPSSEESFPERRKGHRFRLSFPGILKTRRGRQSNPCPPAQACLLRRRLLLAAASANWGTPECALSEGRLTAKMMSQLRKRREGGREGGRNEEKERRREGGRKERGRGGRAGRKGRRKKEEKWKERREKREKGGREERKIGKDLDDGISPGTLQSYASSHGSLPHRLSGCFAPPTPCLQRRAAVADSPGEASGNTWGGSSCKLPPAPLQTSPPPEMMPGSPAFSTVQRPSCSATQQKCGGVFGGDQAAHNTSASHHISAFSLCALSAHKKEGEHFMLLPSA